MPLAACGPALMHVTAYTRTHSGLQFHMTQVHVGRSYSPLAAHGHATWAPRPVGHFKHGGIPQGFHQRHTLGQGVRNN